MPRENRCPINLARNREACRINTALKLAKPAQLAHLAGSQLCCTLRPQVVAFTWIWPKQSTPKALKCFGPFGAPHSKRPWDCVSKNKHRSLPQSKAYISRATKLYVFEWLTELRIFLQLGWEQIYACQPTRIDNTDRWFVYLDCWSVCNAPMVHSRSKWAAFTSAFAGAWAPRSAARQS